MAGTGNKITDIVQRKRLPFFPRKGHHLIGTARDLHHGHLLHIAIAVARFQAGLLHGLAQVIDRESIARSKGLTSQKGITAQFGDVLHHRDFVHFGSLLHQFGAFITGSGKNSKA